jgi:adenylyltransferase/sulfurtransferase
MQVAEALNLLCGALEPSQFRLVTYDVWTHNFHRTELGTDSMASCPVCSEGRLDYLNGSPLRTVTLCGRNAVQLIPSVKADLNFRELSKSIPASGDIQFNDFLLKCSAPPYEVTLFRDGRAIIKGTEEAALARSVYSKLIGT